MKFTVVNNTGEYKVYTLSKAAADLTLTIQDTIYVDEYSLKIQSVQQILNILAVLRTPKYINLSESDFSEYFTRTFMTVTETYFDREVQVEGIFTKSDDGVENFLNKPPKLLSSGGSSYNDSFGELISLLDKQGFLSATGKLSSNSFTPNNRVFITENTISNLAPLIVTPVTQITSISPQYQITNTLSLVTSLTTGDIDGDGDLDVILTSAFGDTVAWFENDGAGIFGAEQTISNSQDGARSVFAGDMDGDGDLDVISASQIDNTIAWFENDGTGIFGTEQTISNLQDGAASVVVGDIDGDGDLDAISASEDDDTIAWFENDGTGTFGTEKTISNSQDGATSVVVGDINGDGDLDVISASENDDTIAWFENDGTGTFGTEQTISNLQDSAASVVVGDMDGDGDLDVISASENDDTIAWFENDGTGIFSAEQTISNSQDGATSVFAGDIDGDGDLDVISASIIDDTVAWFENDGTGTFGAEQVINSTILFPFTAILADIDGDNDLDVVTSAFNVNTVFWYQNNKAVFATNENTALSISTSNKNAITITDPDAGTGNLSVTLSVTNGILDATNTGGVIITGGNSTNLSLYGTLTQINTALNGLIYTPALNYFSTPINSETITITVNDNGNTGIGGTLSNTVTHEIHVAFVPPVVIDLDGDGVEFIDLDDEYYLDVDGDGILNQTTWAGADDAVLIYDANGDGQVSGPEEFAFASYIESAQTDLSGLRFFDSNANDALDEGDVDFNSFYLWQDINRNGLVDEGEWTSLINSNIQSVSLTSDNQQYLSESGDVLVHGTTDVIYRDGTKTTAADAAFSYLSNSSNKYSISQSDILDLGDMSIDLLIESNTNIEEIAIKIIDAIEMNFINPNNFEPDLDLLLFSFYDALI
ncbi:MAG: VCBS repeat-containing protein [Halopseudomonas aestusnigri]